jgi:diguanylate cyclase (GGDEF)-like protein
MQPRWSATAVSLEDASVAGERIVAKVRVALCFVLALIPLYTTLVASSAETYVGLGVSAAVMAIAFSMLLAAELTWPRPWFGFLSTAVDVSLVSAALSIFFFLDAPLTAVNSRVIFECYFLGIGATCLRYDRRLCVWAGLLASGQFIAINAYAVSHWPIASPEFVSAAYGTFDWSTQISRVVVLLTAAILATLIVVRTQRLRQLSTVDRLTGLLNRGYFDERIDEEASRARRYGRPLSIAVLDLDRFKDFNDSFGHAAGDEALRTLAGALKASVRRSDIIARYGGEEFVILLPETTPEEALEKLEAIRERIAGLRIAVARRTAPAAVTMSAGIASWPADGSVVDEVMFIADERLFEAKRGGRNRVVGARVAAILPPRDSDSAAQPTLATPR